MPRFLRFDGGHIGVTGDRQAAAAWYVEHLRLQIAWENVEEGQLLVAYPGHYAIALVSTGGGKTVNLWGDDSPLTRAGNLRMCFEVPNLSAVHATLQAESVRVTPITTGIGGLETFDCYDLESTRLTMVAGDPSLDEFISSYDPPRIGVRDYQQATDWYVQHLDMTIAQTYPADRAAKMVMSDFVPIWLETVEPFAAADNYAARPSFRTLDIDEAHEYCRRENLRPSPILGSKTALRVFHFYDLDGNPLYIWSYPQTEPQPSVETSAENAV